MTHQLSRPATVDELYSRVMSRINRQSMEELEELYGDVWASKFFDVENYVHRACKKVEKYGLFGGPFKRVLDIGCGFGYFCAAVECAGHYAVGIDIPHGCLMEVSTAVGFTFVPYRLKRHERIPLQFGSLDLITLMGVNFCDEWGNTQHPPSSGSGWWGPIEYQALIADLFERLSPGGILQFEYNRGPESEFLKNTAWNPPAEVFDNILRFRKPSP